MRYPSTQRPRAASVVCSERVSSNASRVPLDGCLSSSLMNRGITPIEQRWSVPAPLTTPGERSEAMIDGANNIGRAGAVGSEVSRHFMGIFDIDGSWSETSADHEGPPGARTVRETVILAVVFVRRFATS